jgi:hypothetical protein
MYIWIDIHRVYAPWVFGVFKESSFCLAAGQYDRAL